MGRKQRRQDYLRAFKQALAYALRENVDSVIHTGNLFWTQSPPTEVIEECKRTLSRLDQAGIPFWLVYGNRDIGLDAIEKLRNDGLLRRLDSKWQTIGGIAVYGIDAATSLASVSSSGQTPTDKPRVVCSRERNQVTRLKNALGTDLDALLLGGQNGPVDRTESGCRVVSPGSPERVLGKWMTDADTSEWSHPRRVNICSIDDDRITVDSERLDTRDYEGFVFQTTVETTKRDIQHRLNQAELSDKAVLCILRGEKGPNCLSRKSVQDELRDRCEIARVYDRREDRSSSTDAPEISDTDSAQSENAGQKNKSRADVSDPRKTDVELTVESIETHSSVLDSDDVRGTIEILTERGASRQEALRFVRQYAIDMERDEGLYAVRGLGPVTGYLLAQAGITSLKELLACSFEELETVDGLSENRAKTVLENALGRDQMSSTGNVSDETQSNDESNTTTTIVTNGASSQSTQTEQRANVQDPPSFETDDLPVVTRDGRDIHANLLSEYYEAIRSVRTVISTVMQLRGTDIDPDDLTDPRVQYYVMLDACIGLRDSDLAFTGYGQQQQDRLPFRIKDYRHAFGDGDWVTDYQTIAVKPYRDKTQDWLAENTWLEDTHRLVRPCSPGGQYPLPEMVGSLDDLRYALAILSTFPAYPPLPMETGTTERTIPIKTLYSEIFDEVANDHLVDVGTLSPPGQGSGDPISGPVADATPTSRTDAESYLLDYGKLTHLYQRIMPPSGSPIRQSLPVFALDWYRPDTGSFDDMQDLAKHGQDEPISGFRPRLRDMVHRRFLQDRWNYDYITVFPGHKEGSLSRQLVTLAQDAVVETSIVYSPLLERTETTERQREKSREGRKEVALNPEATLKARSLLNGETVILFDDICTTGNSLLAGAHLLREAGASRVIGLTLGFAPGGEATKEIKKPDAYASDIVAGVE